MAVPLKTCPERSSKVPSCEKWSCHHSGSRVVRTATTTPAASAAMAPWLKWWAVCRALGRCAAEGAKEATLRRSGYARRVTGLTFCVCVETPSRRPPKSNASENRRALR